MIRIIFTISLSTLLCSGLLVAKPEGFYIEKLPVGANVTMVQPATTFVPVTERVMLTATDLPQTISLKTININGQKAQEVRVAIYDRNLDRVKYVTIKPDSSFLYTMNSYDSVSVVPQIPKQYAEKLKSMKLQVESDKPLDVAR